jgi:hypothetical protein
VLPIDPLINLIGWTKGSKFVQTDDIPNLDTEWKLNDLEEIGVSQEEMDQLMIEVPHGALLPDFERLSISKQENELIVSIAVHSERIPEKG